MKSDLVAPSQGSHSLDELDSPRDPSVCPDRDQVAEEEQRLPENPRLYKDAPVGLCYVCEFRST